MKFSTRVIGLDDELVRLIEPAPAQVRARLANVLLNNNITTLAALKSMSKREIAGIRHLGRTCVAWLEGRGVWPHDTSRRSYCPNCHCESCTDQRGLK